MAVTIDQFSDQMLARYFTSYFAAWDIFRAAVNAYERRKLDSGVTMQERNNIEVELLWLYGEHAKMIQRRTAFLHGVLAINRPTQEQSDTIKALVDETDEMTDDAENLDAFTDIAIETSHLLVAIHDEDRDDEDDADDQNDGSVA